ncbi:MAG TPA: hypothetical protein VKB22_08265, partial [Gemmatimonadales bacterium]|nr:hypothetical protein [Gemmatimonadales bacterium]
MKRGSGAAGRLGSKNSPGSCTVGQTAPLPRCPATPLGLVTLLTFFAVATANGQADRCVFQITNVDRQGAVVETPRGTNY